MFLHFEDEMQGVPLQVAAHAERVPLRHIGRRKLEMALLDSSIEVLVSLSRPREGLRKQFVVTTTRLMPNQYDMHFELSATFADAELMQGGDSFAKWKLNSIADAVMEVIVQGQRRAVRRAWRDEWIANWMELFTRAPSREALMTECAALRRVLEADPPSRDDVLKGLDWVVLTLETEDVLPEELRPVLECIVA